MVSTCFTNRTDGRALGIPPETVVLVYSGDVNAENAHAVRSIYLAVAILQREGNPAILIRTGIDYYPFLLGPDASWGKGLSIELGTVDPAELPAIHSLANVVMEAGPDARTIAAAILAHANA